MSKELSKKKCEECNTKCFAECFNEHIGSRIALEKACKQEGAKVHIIGP